MRACQISLTFLGAIIACVSQAEYVDHHESLDYYAYPKYAYQYGVQDKETGDFKTASEKRVGSITTGSYSYLAPDGILRTVKYVVNGNGGFQATVINSGPGIHPKIVH